MGKFSRDKGKREELAIVNYWRAYGMDCTRVPLSGATDFHKGDVVLHGMQGEVKIRRAGFKQIYDWLAGNDFLAIRANNQPRLYVFSEDQVRKLFKDAGYIDALTPETAVRGGE